MFDKDHCSNWSGIGKTDLNDFQRVCVEILVRSFRSGVYNLPVYWKTVVWSDKSVRFTLARVELSTFDFDRLTRLVLAAHEYRVRIAVTARAHGYLAITMSKREASGPMFVRHPPIEEAISDWDSKK